MSLACSANGFALGAQNLAPKKNCLALGAYSLAGKSPRLVRKAIFFALGALSLAVEAFLVAGKVKWSGRKARCLDRKAKRLARKAKRLALEANRLALEANRLVREARSFAGDAFCFANVAGALPVLRRGASCRGERYGQTSCGWLVTNKNPGLGRGSMGLPMGDHQPSFADLHIDLVVVVKARLLKP